jgi:hypothetical protein
MNWDDVLPPQLAMEQRTWELGQALLRAYKAGARQRDLAAHLGVSASRAHERISKAERDRRRKSPVERYFAEPPLTGAPVRPSRVLNQRPDWPWKSPEERRQIREWNERTREDRERWDKRQAESDARMATLRSARMYVDLSFFDDEDPAIAAWRVNGVRQLEPVAQPAIDPEPEVAERLNAIIYEYGWEAEP